MKTLIIAEPGGTGEGRLDLMMRLVDTAADCGASVIKPQWTSSAERMCERRHAPDYLEDYRKLQFPLEYHAQLRDAAHARGMQYGCSVYLPGDPRLVAPFVDYLKISSFESQDHDLVSEAFTVLPPDRVIVSYGMGADWRFISTKRLACTSAYPAPLDALNLRRMVDEYGDRDFDGFSDHSHDVRAGAWAVCAGAEIIETHFRLDSCDPANKDYAVAFTPAELKTYVQNIRDCELALGDGVKRIMPAEEPMLRFRARV